MMLDCMYGLLQCYCRADYGLLQCYLMTVFTDLNNQSLALCLSLEFTFWEMEFDDQEFEVTTVMLQIKWLHVRYSAS